MLRRRPPDGQPSETAVMRWFRRVLGLGEFPGPLAGPVVPSSALEAGPLDRAPGVMLALPDLPHPISPAGRNFQVGAQPERAAAVQAGHSVTGPYLLSGGLPVPAATPERLTASLELLFHPNPRADLHGRGGAVPIGPVGPRIDVRPS